MKNGATLITYDPQMDAHKAGRHQIEDMIFHGNSGADFIFPLTPPGGRTIMQECKDAGIYVVKY